MDITLKLSKDFERCLEDLKKKYGEDFEYITPTPMQTIKIFVVL